MDSELPSQGNLMAKTGYRQSSIAQALDGLQRKKLLERYPDSHSRTNQLIPVRLTDEGVKAFRRLFRP